MIFKLAAYKDRRCRHLDPTLDSGVADIEGQKDESASENEQPRSASVVTEAAMIWTSLTIANVLLLGIHIGLLLTSRCAVPPEWNAAMRGISNWSPIPGEIDIPIHAKRASRTLLPTPHALHTRERSGPEDDAAWDYFEKVRTHVATRADILRLDKDPDKVARFEDSYCGLVDDAYMFQLNTMHQTHCLNILRKAAFSDWKNETHNSTWWAHLSNCVDGLLQNLQQGNDTPSLDLNVNAKCHNSEAIRE